MKNKTLKTIKRQNELVSLATRGFAIHQQLLVLNEEFKQIKDRLKSEAEAHPAEHVPLSDKQSEGSQWVLSGEGCECRIIFSDARLKSAFDPSEPEFTTIRSLAGDHFDSLFSKAIIYRLADKRTFRSHANRLLGLSSATQLLDLSTNPSEPKAVWKARPITHLGS